jgi:light-regulated signal transduction histidine kinase (bacteriophytochrome)
MGRTTFHPLLEPYEKALRSYLHGAGEEALASAYTLGRQALVDGENILELVGIHHSALRAIDAEAPLDDQALVHASEFLGEMLSPFEMTHRGFKEAYERLALLNSELTRKNEALEEAATVLKGAKRETELANKELEAFSYSVAHDLRAPLRGIDGFGQALEEEYAPALGEEGQRYLRHIRSGALRMAQLIDDLLRLSRVGLSEMRLQTVDVTGLVRTVEQELRQASPERNVVLTVAEGMTASADPWLLRIVFENLLGNAWKFTSRRSVGQITCGTELSGERTTFFITDNGAGFDPRYRDRLFSPFQRLHTTAEFEGTGVGLAIVQRIVRRHGGEIQAEGVLDRSATFRFTLAP